MGGWDHWTIYCRNRGSTAARLRGRYCESCSPGPPGITVILKRPEHFVCAKQLFTCSPICTTTTADAIVLSAHGVGCGALRVCGPPLGSPGCKECGCAQWGQTAGQLGCWHRGSNPVASRLKVDFPSVSFPLVSSRKLWEIGPLWWYPSAHPPTGCCPGCVVPEDSPPASPQAAGSGQRKERHFASITSAPEPLAWNGLWGPIEQQERRVNACFKLKCIVVRNVVVKEC